MTKLVAIEDFLNFSTIKIKTSQVNNISYEDELEIKEEIIDFDNLNESMKFGKGQDFSWNKIKKSIASMKFKEECLDGKGAIYFIAILNSEEITNINNQIALDDAYIDLFF